MIERVQSLQADHLLITGDLTTTALPGEFLAESPGRAAHPAGSAATKIAKAAA